MLALLLEGLLVLAVLTLAWSDERQEQNDVQRLVSFESSSEPEPEPEQDEVPPEIEPQKTPQAEVPVPQPPEVVQSAPPPETPSSSPPLIPLSREQLASADIAEAPVRPAAPASQPLMGPPDTGTPGDTPRVGGTGPNGEPLYAAAWYREPYDDELSGYLSTANGPGWGLIACRTVPDYRVEDCVALDEHPRGSNITRAVLAAAWQFRVRPPRLGGRSMVGEWVRIRIDYDVRR